MLKSNMDDATMKLLRHVDAARVAGLSLFVPKRVEDLLTMIVTTSVIPIHPETRLLQEVMASHSKHEPDLAKCRKIIVCDHPKLSVSGDRQFKSGKVLDEDMVRYEEYIRNLECFAKQDAFPFESTKILRCTRYRGFAMAVHEALKEVTTPFVMIIQHDRVLSRSFNVRQTLDLLQEYPSIIKYVGLASNKSEGQVHMLSSRYQIDITPKVLLLGESGSIEEDEECLRILRRQKKAPVAKRILVPLIFWYDSTHIACTKHYRDFVFGEHRLENVEAFEGRALKLGTGDFIEDKIGQLEREDIKANGMEVHAKYGNYLLEDGQGPFVQHCHGRLIGTSNARTFEIYFG